MPTLPQGFTWDDASSGIPRGFTWDDTLQAGKQYSPEQAAAVGKSAGLSDEEVKRNYALKLAQSPEATTPEPAAGAAVTHAQGIPIVGGFIPDTPGSTEFKQQHPWLAKGAEIAGGVMGMIPAMHAAPALFGLTGGPLARFGLGALSGGGVSAADTAVRTGGDINQTAISGALGAAGGALLPPTIGWVTKGLGYLVDKFGPNAAKGALQGIDPLAIKWAGEAAKADGLTDEEVARKFADLGPQGMMAEYGPFSRGVAATIASKPDPIARRAITDVVERRAAGTKDALSQGLDNAFGTRPINGPDYENFIRDAQKEFAGPYYEQAKGLKINPTPEIKDLYTRLNDVGAIDAGNDLMRAQGRSNFLEKFFTTGQQKQWPTVEAWMNYKRGLDSLIEKNDRSAIPNKNLAHALMDLRSDMQGVMSRYGGEAGQVWREADQEHSARTRLLEAFETGKSLLNGKTDPNQLPYILDKMDGSTQKALVYGARNWAEDTLRGKNGIKAIQDMFTTDSPQRRMLEGLVGKPETENLSKLATQRQEYEKTARVASSPAAAKDFAKELVATPEGPKGVGALLEKLGNIYVPSVAPLSAVSTVLKALAESSAPDKAKAMADLARLQARQGPEALATYNALRNLPMPLSERYGPSAQQYIQALGQGMLPTLTRPVQRKDKRQ